MEGRRTIDSPVYKGLIAATDQAFAGQFDIRIILDFENAPLEYVREYCDKIGLVPHTTLFTTEQDEGLERGVAENWWTFFTERDKESVVLLFTQLMKTNYIKTFENNKRDLTICVAPPPTRDLDNLALVELDTIFRWLLPFYKDNFTLLVCLFDSIQNYHNVSAYSIMRQSNLWV